MTSKAQGKTNRLIRSKNPYLRQHAQNPVDWYPWSTEAFTKAAAENKPVFLSIGYSTCHWCHVMEAESFSDPEVATLMNDTFVCIKVDREERPDLDHIYMAFCQQMTGSGGWPMTIIMTPDRKPFFAGTYFPKDGKEGRIGMLQLLPKVRDLWTNRMGKARTAANEIFAALQEQLTPRPEGNPHKTLTEKTFLELCRQYDEQHGGFGKAPKFPVPVNILFLLRYWRRTGSARALSMALKTLRAIRRGGIYDHIGYGLHRYSTDERWLVPHFEKMLCDQALAAMAFTEAYRATREEDLRETAREILFYVAENLPCPDGAFYSAEDADSEGEEGRYYTWKTDELKRILSEDEFIVARGLFNISLDGNYSSAEKGDDGQNVLFRVLPDQQAADEFGLSLDRFQTMLESIRNKILREREKRTRPFMDTKIMTDWNGLMIAAMAMAAGTFDEAWLAETAEKALDYILENMKDEEGNLLHIRYSRHDFVPGCLDDYAYLLWGMVELYQSTFKVKHLKGALSLADEMLRIFWDNSGGGLFFAPRGTGPVPIKHKFAQDSALPSGSSVAAMNLLRLGRLCARTVYDEKTAVLGHVYAPAMNQYPAAYTHLISVFDMAFNVTAKVIIIGDPEKEDTLTMISALRGTYAPNTVAAFIPSTSRNSEIVKYLPYVHDPSSVGGRATAVVCKDFVCHSPTTDPEEMLATIRDVEEGKL